MLVPPISTEVQALLDVPAAQRAAALEQWLAAQPDEDVASEILARTLAAMEHVQHGANSALATFLDAEKIRFPLDEAAEKASDPRVQAELWVHASSSSLITGELADLPYVYARRAVRANPASESGWDAVIEALHSDNADFVSEDLEAWLDLARTGAVPVAMVRRVLAGAWVIAERARWSDGDMAVLERMKVVAAKLG